MEKNLSFEIIEAVDPKKILNKIYALDHGAIVYCLAGHAEAKINLDRIEVGPDMAITFFPGDVVQWLNVDTDFAGEIIRYDAEVLREASLNMEHEIYSLLRQDHICSDSHIAKNVAKPMFDLIKFYSQGQKCRHIDRILVLQLTTFFLGFYDFITSQAEADTGEVSNRKEEIFHRFMELIERDHARFHDVNHYAEELCITPKYLNIISTQKTKKTPKKIIDDYLVLQIKMALHSTNLSIAELCDRFGFSDQSFFVRYFKTHVGMPPTAFRKIFG